MGSTLEQPEGRRTHSPKVNEKNWSEPQLTGEQRPKASTLKTGLTQELQEPFEKAEAQLSETQLRPSMCVPVGQLEGAETHNPLTTF